MQSSPHPSGPPIRGPDSRQRRGLPSCWGIAVERYCFFNCPHRRLSWGCASSGEPLHGAPSPPVGCAPVDGHPAVGAAHHLPPLTSQKPSELLAKDAAPLPHCATVWIKLWHSLCSLLGFFGRFCSYWQPNFPAVSAVTQRPEGRDIPAISVISGLDFPAVAFLAWVILKNSMGDRQIFLVSTTGFSVLNTGIFWREAKTKRLFSQCVRNPLSKMP